MSTLFVVTLAGIATAICFGVGDWLQARTSKRLGGIETYFAVNLISLFIIGIIIALSDITMPNPDQLIRMIIGGALIAVAYLLFIIALSSGAIGIVVPLGSIYPLITLLLTIVLLDQIFETSQVLAMVVIVVGTAILAYEKNHHKIPSKEFHRNSMLALAASVVWGVGFFVINPLFGQVSWQLIFLVDSIIMVIIAVSILIYLHRDKAIKIARKSLSSKTVILAGIVLNGGAMIFYWAAEYGEDIIIPAVIASTAPLIASIMGAIIEKERLGVLKRIGAVIIVGGVIVLNLN